MLIMMIPMMMNCQNLSRSMLTQHCWTMSKSLAAGGFLRKTFERRNRLEKRNLWKSCRQKRMFINQSPESPAVQIPVFLSRDPLPLFSNVFEYVMVDDWLVQWLLMMIWITNVPSMIQRWLSEWKNWKETWCWIVWRWDVKRIWMKLR